MSRHKNTTRDFWNKVNKKSDDECWEWEGIILPSGYGQFKMNYIDYRAHRLAYELTHSSIPKGLLVCHSCDNRKCCNPKHLWLGTTQDNTQDRANKNRTASKELNGSCKLTSEDVEKIRSLYSFRKHIMKQLSNEFDVCYDTIFKIIHHIYWK
jgi:hypothetical protein